MTIKKPPPVILPARFAHQPRVKAPTPKQVKALRVKHELTQAEAGLLIYTTHDAWRQYEKSRDQPNAREMRPSLWELFRIKVGDIDPASYAEAAPVPMFTRPTP